MYGRIHCEQCGRVDVSLRHSVFTTVMSFIILSHRSQQGGVYCASCRSILGNKAALISGLLGWWGIPFGIFWTIGALASDLGGGKKDSQANAALLRTLAWQLAQDQRVPEAREALVASQEYGYQPDAARLIGEIDAQIGVPAQPLASNTGYSASQMPARSHASNTAYSSGRSKGWLLIPAAVLVLIILARLFSGQDGPAPGQGKEVAANAPTAPTATRAVRPTATKPPQAGAARATATHTDTGFTSYVTPLPSFGFADDFSRNGGTVTVSVNEPNSLSGQFYESGTTTRAGEFDWSVQLKSIAGTGSACLSLTGQDGTIWYYNVNPTTGTWSVDRTNATAEVFRWVDPRSLPASVGPTIERLAVRVRDHIPAFVVDGLDVSTPSGIPLPALIGDQQLGFCASLIGQTDGWATVIVDEVKLQDMATR